MFRQLLTCSMALTLVWTATGCVGPTLNEPSADRSQPSVQASPSSIANQLADGQYDVQQVTYDDVSGEYRVTLLNTQPGQSSLFQTDNLPMARLTDAEIQAGKKSYLKVENSNPALYLTEDFRIEYVHNVTETQVNPDTGQQETVVVRQEPSFWAPFAGALAGQALGSLLFRPHYYMPPVYQPGVALVGFGGYGSTYNQAVQRYQTRYQAPPAEVRNRQTVRTTGQLRTPSSSNRSNIRRTQGDRPTGSGYGSSTLRRTNPSRESYRRSTRSGGAFGSKRRAGRRR